MRKKSETDFSIDGKRIKALRESLKLTLKDFAQSLGIASPSQVRGWEENEHMPVLTSVRKIKEIYGLDLLNPAPTSYPYSSFSSDSFLINDVPVSANSVMVEMPSDARALAGRHTIDVITEDGIEVAQYQIPRDFLAQFDLIGLKNIKIFEVEGDSMEPDLKAGEKAIVDVSSNSLKDGAIYLLRIEGKTYVKKVFQQDEGLLLISKNPLYPNRLIPKDIEIEVVGRVARKVEFKVHKL